jgi:hypothetical protein
LYFIWFFQDRCGPETAIVVIGNQTDKAPELWKVTSHEAEAWASQNDLFYIETSAKGLINIDEIFSILIEKMIQEQNRNGPGSSKYDINADQSWVVGISSGSLLKNYSPVTFGIPGITEKNATNPLPTTGSIRVVEPPPDRSRKRGCSKRCSLN